MSATWNERDNLALLVQKVRAALRDIPHEIIIVDDSSPDGTYDVAWKLADKAIRKKREGQSLALLEGIRHAKHPTTVTIDADLENDPANIPNLIQALDGGFDVVVAARPSLPRFSERLFFITVGKLLGVSDVLSNFRAMRTNKVRYIQLGKSETFGAELLIHAHRLGLRIGQLKVREVTRRGDPRIGGTVTANLRILKAFVISLIILLRTSR